MKPIEEASIHTNPVNDIDRSSNPESSPGENMRCQEPITFFGADITELARRYNDKCKLHQAHLGQSTIAYYR